MSKFSRFGMLGFFTATCLVAILAWNQRVGKKKAFPSRRKVAATSAGYCIAIRGNGELQPAHWGAMAKTVEQLGLPVGMAGGSSATITMMVMEAIASHPLIAKQELSLQKQRASLMWKSLYGFFTELKKNQGVGEHLGSLRTIYCREKFGYSCPGRKSSQCRATGAGTCGSQESRGFRRDRR